MKTVTEKQLNNGLPSVTDAAAVKVINSDGSSARMTKTNLASAIKSSLNAIDSGEATGGIYESVDLGLPSGTLWARCNVGAKVETEYGDLFAWGATKPYRIEGSTVYDKTNNYAASRANTIQRDLNPCEDAATVNMGSGWRMPSSAQIQELLDYTTNEWTSIGGVYGRKFTSTADSSKHIFFPASGYVNGSSLDGRGSHGNYWSRSFDSAANAWRLNFGSGSANRSTSTRYFGFSVRGVRC